MAGGLVVMARCEVPFVFDEVKAHDELVGEHYGLPRLPLPAVAERNMNGSDAAHD
jgi:hypothetical protein